MSSSAPTRPARVPVVAARQARSSRQLVVAVLVAIATAACSGAQPPPRQRLPAPAPLARPSPPGAAAPQVLAPSRAPAREPATDPPLPPPHPAADLFAGLPTGDAQRERLCARGHRDRIAAIWCRQDAPVITGLTELQRALGLAYDEPGLHTRAHMSGNGHAGNPAFALLGHSTSLTGRLVSPINPRAIVFTPPAHGASSDYVPAEKFVPNPDFVAMAFTRGEQIVELVDRDPDSGDLRFFVVRYEQACNERPEGCDDFDRFTAATERSWLRTSLYDDIDLENTPGDCNLCHQPDGHGTPRKLLMQARQTPWTHYFRNNRDGGRRQIWRFEQAHPADEAYAGIAGSDIRFSDPQLLEGLVENEGFMKQPVSLHAYWQKWGVPARALSANPELSLTWKREHARALAGAIPAVPFVMIDFVDDTRMMAAAAAYREVSSGRAPRERAPYLGDLHRDEVLPWVSLAPPPGADGRAILTSMCRRCHNPTRNPALSRARFDVDALDTLSATELDRARARMKSPPSHIGHMPPRRFGQLTDEQVSRVEQLFDELLDARDGGR